ncbi:MAG: transglutaminase family protein [Fibrobacteres bacterium]|nr:transglutaminase family protein [Fibrobacterota bacterium]
MHGREKPGWPLRPEVDFTDLHAWCEVYLPGAGWVGLDLRPAMAGEGHIPLAPSPPPSAAAAISGGVESARRNSTSRWRWCVPEALVPHAPTTKHTWLEIDRLGKAVDRAKMATCA